MAHPPFPSWILGKREMDEILCLFMPGAQDPWKKRKISSLKAKNLYKDTPRELGAQEFSGDVHS
jgi:hypothetical protein